ncbi:hypothetical protein SBA3_2270017 [Candidatus Sulfopaludibacter sp. SbA3]|nr:hypothetical protein SBA3_2270017 [Candidatus Sulfopaludibacter sp. SbA3]
MKKPVTPAVLPPVALAGRRQDRRRYAFAVPVFRPCELGADCPAKRDEKTGNAEVLPPVALAGRRRDRRRYPSLGRFFDPVGAPARGQRWE